MHLEYLVQLYLKYGKIQLMISSSLVEGDNETYDILVEISGMGQEGIMESRWSIRYCWDGVKRE